MEIIGKSILWLLLVVINALVLSAYKVGLWDFHYWNLINGALFGAVVTVAITKR